MSRPFAQQIGRPVGDHAEQERNYIVHVPMALTIAISLDENILYDVFGVRQTAQATESELDQALLGGFDESIEVGHGAGP
jgi:hypothetical protein